MILLFLPLSAQGQRKATAADELVSSIDGTLQTAQFDHTLAAVHVTDLKSGATLYTRNASLLLRPASNTKLVTSAAAVLQYGGETRVRTRLVATDSSRRSPLCRGGGDPLLTSQDIQKLGEMAYAAGVRHLDTLRMDASLFDSAFYGAGWMWDDESDPFMPYVNPFSVNGNTAVVRMKAPSQNGIPIEVSVLPSSRLYTVESTASSAGSSDLVVRKRPRSNEILIEGSLRKGRSSTKKLSIWRPQDMVAEMLLDALRAAGIPTDSTVVLHLTLPRSSAQREGEIAVAEISRPIDDILAEMNKESDNLSAECVLRLLAQPVREHGIDAPEGLRQSERLLTRSGVPMDDIHLVDGSGISFYNLLTAEALGRLLAVMAVKPQFDRFVKTLAIAGTDGTLAHRLRDMPKGASFRGKTGTVSGVSALSGYAQAPGGRLLGVVILMQNYKGSAKPYREAQDDIVRHCLKYSAAFTEATPPR